MAATTPANQVKPDNGALQKELQPVAITPPPVEQRVKRHAVFAKESFCGQNITNFPLDTLSFICPHLIVQLVGYCPLA